MKWRSREVSGTARVTIRRPSFTWETTSRMYFEGLAPSAPMSTRAGRPKVMVVAPPVRSIS